MFHSFLTLALDAGEWSALHPHHFAPKETVPGITEEKARWTQQLVQVICSRKKSLTPARNLTMIPQLLSP